MGTWQTMRREDFDAAEPLTLFDIEGQADQSGQVRPDDACGTPDLFTIPADSDASGHAPARINWEVVFGPDEDERQLYVDHGDGSWLSSRAEQMATVCYSRLVADNIDCGLCRNGVLIAGVDPFTIPPREQRPSSRRPEPGCP